MPPLDGSGGVPWRHNVHALVPGPAGRWLGVGYVRGDVPRSHVEVIAADGTTSGLGLPAVEEDYPLGWLGNEPVVWRKTVPTPLTATISRGEVWLAGPNPRRLLADVPPGQTVAMAGSRLLYGEQVDDPNLAGPVWLIDLATGQRRQVTSQGRAPVAVRPAGGGVTPVSGLPRTGEGGTSTP